MTEGKDVQTWMEEFAREHIEKNPEFSSKVSAEERKQEWENQPSGTPQEGKQKFGDAPPPNPFAQESSYQEPQREEPGEHTLSEMEKLAKLGEGERVVEFEQGDYAGNKIRIVTINQEKEFEALAASGTHPDSVQARAFMLYSLTHAVTHINGKDWRPRKPISPEDSVMQESYKYLVKLHRPILDRLIREYRELQEEVVQQAFFRQEQTK